jgi:squalene synthase HpnC
MEADHYENLPIASVLLPKALRVPVGVIYQVARTAADIVEEGDWNAAERHARLADFRAGLDAVASGHMAPVHPLMFGKLAGVVAQFKLPLAPFYDLVSALDQDIETTRFADRSAMLEYCRRSAHPVGHLMLHLFDAATPANLADSDTICTALHLINFWQNIAIDLKSGRIYLPQSDLGRFNVTEARMINGVADDAWRASRCVSPGVPDLSCAASSTAGCAFSIASNRPAMTSSVIDRRSMASTGLSSRRARSQCGCPGASVYASLRLRATLNAGGSVWSVVHLPVDLVCAAVCPRWFLADASGCAARERATRRMAVRRRRRAGA